MMLWIWQGTHRTLGQENLVNKTKLEKIALIGGIILRWVAPALFRLKKLFIYTRT
jgi:hypothetical protein